MHELTNHCAFLFCLNCLVFWGLNYNVNGKRKTWTENEFCIWFPLNDAFFTARFILAEFLWAVCSQHHIFDPALVHNFFFICLHVDVYRLVSQLTLPECDTIFCITRHLCKTTAIDFRVCQVHERQTHPGRRKTEWSRLKWCTTMVPLCFTEFPISFQVSVVLYKNAAVRICMITPKDVTSS